MKTKPTETAPTYAELPANTLPWTPGMRLVRSSKPEMKPVRVTRVELTDRGEQRTIIDVAGDLVLRGDDWIDVTTDPERVFAQLLDTIDRSAPIRERRKRAMSNLAKLAELRAAVEGAISENVAQAREVNSAYYDYGAPTWEQIGKALGVTKQSAQARYTAKKP